MRLVWVGRVLAVGLLLLAACGGKSRDETRVRDPVTVDAGTNTSTTEHPAPITRGCPGATPVNTGLDRCGDGVYHRTGSDECAVGIPDGELSPQDQAVLDQFLTEDGNPRRVECTRHTDCNARLLGYCSVNLDSVTVASCVYVCRNDADCDSGEACLCYEGGGACLPAGCRSDDDCAPGSACTAPDALSWKCEHPDDECRSDADCPEGRTCNWCEEHSQCGRDAPCRGTPG